MTNKTGLAASLLAAVAIGLAACTIPDTARTGFRQGDEANGLIAFAGAQGDMAAGERVLFADPIQREEYAYFPLNGGQAEVVYLSTRNVYNSKVALEDWIILDSMIESWNHVRKNGLELGEAFRFDAGWIKMWVKPFELKTSRQKCAGFFSAWDHPARALRPGKILMGYVCKPPGQAFDREEIELSMRAIGIRGVNVPLRDFTTTKIEGLPDNISQDELAQRARSPSEEHSRGNPEFPYRIATVLQFKRIR